MLQYLKWSAIIGLIKRLLQNLVNFFSEAFCFFANFSIVKTNMLLGNFCHWKWTAKHYLYTKSETKIAFQVKKVVAKNSKCIPTIDSWEIINISVMLLWVSFEILSKTTTFYYFLYVIEMSDIQHGISIWES